MAPMNVTSFLVAFGRRNAIAFEPAIDIEEINLFPPQHARESAALNHPFFRGRFGRMDGLVEFVRLFLFLRHHFVYIAERACHLSISQAQMENNRAPSSHLSAVVDAGLGPQWPRIDAVFAIH